MTSFSAEMMMQTMNFIKQFSRKAGNRKLSFASKAELT